MALAKRLIPCLDVDAGRVVKGVRFVGIRDAGDPVLAAIRYDEEGADEIAFLDITATYENRRTLIKVVEQVAKKIFIPLLVGGGIRQLSDVRDLLNAGADRVSINSAAIKNPDLIGDIAAKIGSQCITVAIDAKRHAHAGNWQAYTHGGRQCSGLDAVQWARTMCDHGAGEILLTSMDRDGTRSGFDIDLTRSVSQAVPVPVIASGGVGSLADLAAGVMQGQADAVLAASIFHFQEYSLQNAKRYLHEHGIAVRQ